MIAIDHDTHRFFFMQIMVVQIMRRKQRASSFSSIPDLLCRIPIYGQACLRPWHFLYFLPEPQGQGSLGMIFLAFLR